MSLDLSRWENGTLQWNIRERIHWNSFRGFCWAVRSKQTVWFLFCALMSTLRFASIYLYLYYSIFHLHFCSTLLRAILWLDMPVLFTAWPVWQVSSIGVLSSTSPANFSCVLHKDSFTRFPKQRNWDGNVIRRFRFMSVNELCLISRIFCFGCGCICA